MVIEDEATPASVRRAVRSSLRSGLRPYQARSVRGAAEHDRRARNFVTRRR